MLRRRAFGLLAATLAPMLALAGCTTAGGFGTSYSAYPPPSSPGAAPPVGRVALLVPLSGAEASLGHAMANAAELGLGGPGLDPIDTALTPGGAADAARQALARGDRLVLGPVTSGDTAAASTVTRPAGVPMLAFTSDPARAQPDVWVLGLTPGQQVRRLVGAAQQDGRSRFAGLLPDTPLGHALGDALIQATSAAGLPPPQVRFYGPGFPAMNQAMRDLSDYASRRGAIERQIEAARARGDRKQAAALSRQSPPPPPFDALLVAATGGAVPQLASLLPYYDVGPSHVRLLGPALWANDPQQLGALAGAWYAAPDPAARQSFVQAYTARFGSPPPRLADLAYDGAAIARVAAQSGGFGPEVIANPRGYAGVDGPLLLLPDGQVRRGLAVFEIDRGGGAHIVQPAPESLSPPGA